MIVDYALMCNLLTESSQTLMKGYLGDPYNNSYYKPLFLTSSYNISGFLTVIDSSPFELISRDGIIQGRQQFLSGLKYSVEELGAKIILLAASTKRLFGKTCDERVNSQGQLDSDGFTIQELYPNVLFTNGDNGTSTILNMEIDSVLLKSSIIEVNIQSECEKYYSISGNGSVVVNGLGLLGLDALEHLIELGVPDEQIIVISTYTKSLRELVGDRNIKIYPHLRDIDLASSEVQRNEIRAIINCTHNANNVIDTESIEHIQNKKQKVFVIDVAVPYGFPQHHYEQCQNVYRQDGGNAYIADGLEFFFNPALCGLTDNVLYGCFAETLSLSIFIKEQRRNRKMLDEFDFFNVNTRTKIFVKSLFDKYGVGIAPKPFNFMQIEE